MKVTLDANILFSAIIRKGVTRKLLFQPDFEFFAPEFIRAEFNKYAAYLRGKFTGTDEEFMELTELLLSAINFVSDKSLKPYLPAAAVLIKDEKDWLYIACALKEDTILWSNDKGFKSQKRVMVFTASEMAESFGVL